MNVHYVTGSRADFGLMRLALTHLARQPGFAVEVVMTGQALIDRYGEVKAEIAAAGLPIAARIPVTLSGTDGQEMALALADELAGLTRLWSVQRPDLVLVLGDRGEMLAAAIAAFHLEIPIAHIHGGERSGTLDEGFRHAISKLATYHFPATRVAAERLIRMGEAPSSITVVGAPGLVELADPPAPDPAWLRQRFALQPGGWLALMMFHPVVQERGAAFEHTRAILAALRQSDARTIVLRPNSDAGGKEIERALAAAVSGDDLRVCDHLARTEYLRAVASADLLIGNSSSGIIESASLGTPCVNLGSRQDGRERNANTVDCPDIETAAIAEAIASARALDPPFENLYGDGRADQRLHAALAALPRDHTAPKKQNAY